MCVRRREKLTKFIQKGKQHKHFDANRHLIPPTKSLTILSEKNLFNLKINFVTTTVKEQNAKK